MQQSTNTNGNNEPPLQRRKLNPESPEDPPKEEAKRKNEKKEKKKRKKRKETQKTKETKLFLINAEVGVYDCNSRRKAILQADLNFEVHHVDDFKKTVFEKCKQYIRGIPYKDENGFLKLNSDITWENCKDFIVVQDKGRKIATLSNVTTRNLARFSRRLKEELRIRVNRFGDEEISKSDILYLESQQSEKIGETLPVDPLNEQKSESFSDPLDAKLSQIRQKLSQIAAKR